MTTTVTKPRSRLTDQSIKRMRLPAEGRVQIPDSVVGGLWLRVSATGARSWSVLYRRGDRKSARVTLGKWPAIGCGAARALAKDVLVAVAGGGDPAAIKRARRHQNGDAFEQVASEWLARQVHGRGLRSARAVEGLVRNKLVAAWSGRRIGDIGRPDIHRVLDAELDAGHARSANKTLAVMRRLFAWSIERGYLAADPTSGIRPPARAQSRERILADDELAAVWRAAGDAGWPWGPFTRLLVLSGQRRSEVAAMTWSEVDLGRALWTIPAARSKSGRAHELPLSPPALEILGGLPRIAGSPFVFPGRTGRPLTSFSAGKTRLDELSGVAGWTFHDIRRTTASGMARLAVAPHVIAAILNHSPGQLQGITAVYNRYKYSDEMRRALASWADQVIALAGGGTAKVVALR